MSDYPKPHINREWSPDLVEDYSHARNDDERRMMLLSFGFDIHHEGEVYRLFGDPPADPLPDSSAHDMAPPSSTDNAAHEPVESQNSDHRSKQKKVKSDVFKKSCKGVAAFLGLLATLFTIIDGWPSAASLFKNLFTCFYQG